jgi:phosphoglycolate phosphatase-like HAD superfamily hydrolase
MFDVDGTLVDSAGFDGTLYARAVRDVLDVDVDRTWASYRNVTDSGILEEILQGSELESAADQHREHVKRRFVALTREYLLRHPSRIREIAGANALIRTLLAARGVRVAIATGGWRETAALKLTAIGLDPSSIAFASASDATARAKIMEIAERRALQGASPAKITYFGDGEWDKRASAALGYDFVAIGDAVEHDVQYNDFTQHDTIVARLGLTPVRKALRR